MGSLGPFELILIFLAVLLLFGAKRIPEIARGLGKGIREFKTATKEITDEFRVDESQNRIQSPAQPLHGSPAPRQAETVAPPAAAPTVPPTVPPSPASIQTPPPLQDGASSESVDPSVHND